MPPGEMFSPKSFMKLQDSCTHLWMPTKEARFQWITWLKFLASRCVALELKTEQLLQHSIGMHKPWTVVTPNHETTSCFMKLLHFWREGCFITFKAVATDDPGHMIQMLTQFLREVIDSGANFDGKAFSGKLWNCEGFKIIRQSLLEACAQNQDFEAFKSTITGQVKAATTGISIDVHLRALKVPIDRGMVVDVSLMARPELSSR